MLKAALRRWLDLEPAKRQKEPRTAFVTYEEMEAYVQMKLEGMEFEMNEWHEKFSTLHARLSKREKKTAPKPQSPNNGETEEQERLPSVLNFRKPWSV